MSSPETLNMRCTGRKVQGGRKAQGEMAAGVSMWGVGQRGEATERMNSQKPSGEPETPVSQKPHVKEEAADGAGASPRTQTQARKYSPVTKRVEAQIAGRLKLAALRKRH